MERCPGHVAAIYLRSPPESPLVTGGAIDRPYGMRSWREGRFEIGPLSRNPLLEFLVIAPDKGAPRRLEIAVGHGIR